MLDKKSLLKADNTLLTIANKKIADPKRTVIKVFVWKSYTSFKQELKETVDVLIK